MADGSGTDPIDPESRESEFGESPLADGRSRGCRDGVDLSPTPMTLGLSTALVAPR